MIDDVLVNKSQTIERCIRRIHEEYGGEAGNLANYTKQDSIVLNIQRACEAAIDLAMHIIAENSWEIPQSSREAFTILRAHGVLDEAIAKRMAAMVGFRNIAVHNYQDLDLAILRAVVENHLGDFGTFVAATVRSMG